MLSNPINLPKWLEENSHLLKPPINNYCVYNDDFTVMIVGGPNARTDYHINTTPEWFYQYKGAMTLKVVDPADAPFKDIVIREATCSCCPPTRRTTPSASPTRSASCSSRAARREASIACADLGTQIKAAVNEFKASEEKRRCGACGTMAEAAPRPGSIRDPNLE
ncbi:3-hydroxyanthranilate 3,4-dioxygenase [Verticillium alfalfae VaMs.102]|uniref:3-hydroxyanthranilate 3,4-dioxygenase n=1 Tax=Verticillium alfalfae (strain VaMs.102 / ATCC MYA-4576 / FGSC 10136) TaxID=526221 RepID=C9SHM7_VERA1|nr:3-hydroxyanthranilate 3,4-dioxygenase [Verticillium alfalfae VaMs.102]EEY18450.1 3-hydroxyanthranilate 3,4-dioxygenase [Verticillium alfalfae VaMs.102]